MKNEFIPYEEALALKELGFDEPCLGLYSLQGSPNPILIKGESFTNTDKVEILYGEECTAPLYQQAFRWFREKYDIQSYIKPLSDKTWSVYIDRWGHHIVPDYMIFNTYKEAELACLRKLIEIVNQNKDE